MRTASIAKTEKLMKKRNTVSYMITLILSIPLCYEYDLQVIGTWDPISVAF
jgi:hypothetical protein